MIGGVGKKKTAFPNLLAFSWQEIVIPLQQEWERRDK
jgi:hypothetical protein